MSSYRADPIIMDIDEVTPPKGAPSPGSMGFAAAPVTTPVMMKYNLLASEHRGSPESPLVMRENGSPDGSDPSPSSRAPSAAASPADEVATGGAPMSPASDELSDIDKALMTWAEETTPVTAKAGGGSPSPPRGSPADSAREGPQSFVAELEEGEVAMGALALAPAQAPTPAAEAPTPAAETPTPAAEAPTPAAEAPAPAVEAVDSPPPAPAAPAQLSPAAASATTGLRSFVAELYEGEVAAEAQPPAVEAPPPAVEAPPPAVEAPAPAPAPAADPLAADALALAPADRALAEEALAQRPTVSALAAPAPSPAAPAEQSPVASATAGLRSFATALADDSEWDGCAADDGEPLALPDPDNVRSHSPYRAPAPPLNEVPSHPFALPPADEEVVSHAFTLSPSSSPHLAPLPAGPPPAEMSLGLGSKFDAVADFGPAATLAAAPAGPAAGEEAAPGGTGRGAGSPEARALAAEAMVEELSKRMHKMEAELSEARSQQLAPRVQGTSPNTSPSKGMSGKQERELRSLLGQAQKELSVLRKQKALAVKRRKAAEALLESAGFAPPPGAGAPSSQGGAWPEGPQMGGVVEEENARPIKVVVHSVEEDVDHDSLQQRLQLIANRIQQFQADAAKTWHEAPPYMKKMTIANAAMGLLFVLLSSRRRGNKKLKRGGFRMAYSTPHTGRAYFVKGRMYRR